jgi:hypothetical protein
MKGTPLRAGRSFNCRQCLCRQSHVRNEIEPSVMLLQRRQIILMPVAICPIFATLTLFA